MRNRALRSRYRPRRFVSRGACGRRLAHHGSNPSDVVATIISFEEQLSGWYRVLRKAKTNEQIARAYEELTSTVRFYGSIRVIDFPEPAIDLFDQLLKMKRNVGGMDLRIAAIARHAGATVVTRNTRDFGRVPGLKIVDWTQP